MLNVQDSYSVAFQMNNVLEPSQSGIRGYSGNPCSVKKKKKNQPNFTYNLRAGEKANFFGELYFSTMYINYFY